MSATAEALKQLLDKHPSAPFLFVGSGFSRRYIGLENWSDLLERFCNKIRPFGYYHSKADGDLPLTASYMAEDYNEWWWSSSETEESRIEAGESIKNKSDALKYEISKYLSNYSLEDARKLEIEDEISTIQDICVDGIITTNWDSLLEDLFPDYKVFIGQEELIFSNPQEIGEIYKIHGCASKPNSLVLTQEDYKYFSERNPYLAAKLVTIFVEHPIIFIGYSISDPNVREIITSIGKCLTQEKIGKFQDNLIFISRAKEGETEEIEKSTIQSDDFTVTLTIVKIKNYSDIYNPLTSIKRKIPTKLLRFFKEQMYELVHNPEITEKKLAVMDADEIESASSVEFVVGLGVAKRQQELGKSEEDAAQTELSKKGYAGITANEIFMDCIQNESRFNANDLLSTALPAYIKSSRTFIPVFRYLKAVGIHNMEQLKQSDFNGAKQIVTKLLSSNFTSSGYAKRFRKEFSVLSTAEIIEKSTSPSEAILMLAFQNKTEVDLKVLQNFLLHNSGSELKDYYKTALNKLICRYDYISSQFEN